MTNELMDLDLLELDDEDFLELEKHQTNGITYPAMCVWKRVGANKDGCFSISALARPYFTAEAYRIHVSENYIVFVPSTKEDRKAYWLRKYRDNKKGFDVYSIHLPSALIGVESGIHKLKKCKKGLCISRKADKEE